MIDLRKEELINAKMTIILGSATPLCFLEMTSVEVSMIKHLAIPRVDYVSSGRMIPRITSATGLEGPPSTRPRLFDTNKWAEPIP